MAATLDISLLHRVAQAADAQSLGVVMRQASAALGANDFFCTIRCSRPHVEPVCWAFSSNSLWTEQYLSLRLGSTDPLLPQDETENGVSEWSLAGTEAEPGLFSSICDQAMFRSGWVARLSQNPIWKMALVCTLPTHSHDSLRGSRLEAFRVLSVVLLQSLIANIMPEILNAALPKISARELSCLSWAARGYTAGDIAQKLEISEPTVVFHMNNLIRKLGVNNRTQAIAVGIAKGLTY